MWLYFLEKNEELLSNAEKLAEKAGISKRKAAKLLKTAETAYEIPYNRFIRYKLYDHDKEEWPQIVKENDSERRAARRRKNTVKEHVRELPASEEQTSASRPDKFPDPIIAACWYLGSPLPEGASTSKKLSEYVGEIDGSLETIRKRVGRKYIPKTQQTETEFESFTKVYSSMIDDASDTTDLSVYYVDYCFHCKDYGFGISDYYSFEFYNKEAEEREKFVSIAKYKRYVRSVCIKDSYLFKNKAYFNRFFSDFINRKWLDATECTLDEFKQFVSEHPVFFAKPMTGTQGAGAGIIDAGSRKITELFAECRKNQFIMEEIVVQHPEIAAFNKDSLNTIRIYALADIDNNAHITGALIRFGRAGKNVDNFHAGGMGAAIDPETGIIITDAVDVKGNKMTVHPDSGLKFKGFQIPEWDAVKKTVEAATRKCSDRNRHVGWDVAITKEGKTEVIEANSEPAFDFLQAVDKIGKYDIYDRYMTPLAEAAGVKVYKQMLPRINTEGMTRE